MRFGIWLLANGRDVERKPWMPAFAGMTWGGRWAGGHAGWYNDCIIPDVAVVGGFGKVLG
jgi:hypothetical protein